MDHLVLIDLLSRFPIRRKIEETEAEFRSSNDSIQLGKLVELLCALKTNRYYGSFLESQGNIDVKNALSIFGNLPILTKEIINSNEHLILNNPLNVKLNKIQTSGSSGIRGFAYLSHEELMINRSLQLMWWNWAGYKPGQLTIQLGVNVKRDFQKRVKDFLLNIDYQLAFGQSDEEIYESLKKYRNRKVHFLGGYASSLYLYALVSEKYSLNIHVKGCISWGDKLFDHFKMKISQVFGCRVFETYGSSEGFNIAGECEYGSLHVMKSHLHIEILDKNNLPVESGIIGDVVLTRLDAKHFPLVRYRVGDLAIMRPDNFQCSCGRVSPVIEKIIGRDTDIIYYEGGYLTVQVLVYFMKQVPGIDKWQIIQAEDRSLTLKLCVKQSYRIQDEEIIRYNILRAVANKLELRIEYVEKLNYLGVGKPQLVVSKLKSFI